MLAEVIGRLRFEAFWGQTDKNTFKEIGQKFSDYYKSLHEMNEKSCKRKLKQSMESTELKPLLDCLDKFSGECGSRSEQCMFWNNFLEIVNMIKSLVRADRDGDFPLPAYEGNTRPVSGF